MKPDDIILGQFYAIEENTSDESLEHFLRGTNRVVKIVRRADYTSKRFIAEHYGFPIASDWIKCWIPGVGELAEFSDNQVDWYLKTFAGYTLGHMRFPMKIDDGDCYRYARPVQTESIKTKSNCTPSPLPLSRDEVKTLVRNELLTIINEGLCISARPANPFFVDTPDSDKGV